MEVDAMSPEKRTSLMKKGTCFICEEPGHLARDCQNKDKKKKKKDEKKNETPKKMMLKDIHAYIKAMNKEDREKLISLQIGGENSDEEEEKKDF